MVDRPSLQRVHVDDTRRALVASARQLFGELGYARTSLDEVVAAAGVTKGALYHHFSGKQDLFLAVYDQVEGELSERSVAAGADGTDPVDSLRRGFAAFLDTALDRDVQRIALLDSLAVLGPTKFEVDARHSLAGVRAAVRLGVEQGLLEPLDSESVARLLLAACSEAAIVIATAPDPAAARIEVGATLDRLLVGLAPASDAPGSHRGQR